MVCYICSSGVEEVYRKIYRCSKCFTLQRKDPFEYYSSVKGVYDSSYYRSRYFERYGKEISLDVENIRKMANKRMDTIENVYLREGECSGCSSFDCGSCYVRNFVSSLRGKRVLDVGCGIGVFLEVAKSRGYDIVGVDLNKDVLHIVSSSIRDNIVISSFEEFDTREKFDVVTMWYVLEHLPDPESVLKKAWNILKYGGVLAISTPNGNGASVRFKPRWYYSVIPEDHIFEFSVEGISIMLSRNNFKIVNVVNSGFHPERVVKLPILKNLFGIYQRIINLGDTFEVYAVKKFSKSK
ncbi:MAG: class I SAM-dependent methyltransferase [Brevinematia bacterium]